MGMSATYLKCRTSAASPPPGRYSRLRQFPFSPDFPSSKLWFNLIFFYGYGLSRKGSFATLLSERDPFKPVLVVAFGVIFPEMEAPALCPHQGRPERQFS